MVHNIDDMIIIIIHKSLMTNKVMELMETIKTMLDNFRLLLFRIENEIFFIN